MNIFELLKSINPGDIQQAMQQYGAEYAAFKQGFRAATDHFSARLNTIEAKQDEILTILRDLSGRHGGKGASIPARLSIALKGNGYADDH